MTGIDAQAAASYKKDLSVWSCSCKILCKCSAIIFLLELTTSLLFLIAFVTIRKAASASSITSTMTLIWGSFNRRSLFVVNNSAGAFLFFSGCLMQIFLILACREGVWFSILYNPSPTVPKPKRPITSFLWVTIFELLKYLMCNFLYREKQTIN